MNCSEFEDIVVDLARGLALDAALKQRGTAHAQSCTRCAGRLKNEQTVSRGLRAVAKGDQFLSAPAAVETALLAAFRAREEAVPVAARAVVPAFVASPLKQFFRQFRWALIPALAAAVVLIALAVARVQQPSAPPQRMIVENTPAPTAPATQQQTEEIVVPPPREERLEGKTNNDEVRRPVQVKANPHQLVASRRRGSVTVDVGEFVVDEPETISAKDFLVFDYAQNLPPADSTHLMRVRLPRERLAPLGIPLPRAARNEDFVNADFLVGSDGVPRAIRVANR